MAALTEAGPDTTHPEYDEASPSWEIMADVLGGEDSVKKAGAKYLPVFEETETDDYERYKQRADFDEITLRAAKAMRGFLFRKDPRLEAPGHEPGKDDEKKVAPKGNVAPFDEFLNDSTLTGKEFYDVAKDCASLVLEFGRGGSLIDWSEDEAQPYTVQYKACDIINWRYERVMGRMILTQIVLCEKDPNNYDAQGNKVEPDNYYEHIFHEQWRELRLEETGVVLYLWRRREIKGSKAEFYLVKPPSLPTRKGKPLIEIPFVFHTSDGPHGEYICPPPLLPMARTNLSLYRTNADLENLRHVLGMPTPYTCGFGDITTPLFLGSTKAWSTDEVNAKCGYLAVEGTQASVLTDAVKEKQDKLASFGARFLESQTTEGRGPEAFGTVALRQTAETATLTDIALALCQSLTDVLAWALWWSTAAADVAEARKLVSYTVNTDFVGMVMDSQTMTALMSLYLQKGISFETLFARLQGADIIPSDRTVDEEKKLIEAGQSQLLAMVPPFGRAPQLGPDGKPIPFGKGAPPQTAQKPASATPEKKPPQKPSA